MKVGKFLNPYNNPYTDTDLDMGRGKERIMNAQELINELEKVKDKTLPVLCEGQEILDVDEDSISINLT